MAFVRVANEADVAPGQVKTVQAADLGIVLCNVHGEIYAMADLCTHDDSPLGTGHLLGDQIECPRHGARFDVKTGEVRSLPAIIPVPTFPVRVERGEIWVDVG